MPYESVIGLEVHVQLLTASKIFCRCPNRFGAEPNSLVCPVCLGYPGTLPVLNGRAVDLAVKLALALGFSVQERSVFVRKNYFYPDLPKGYQISQFDRPVAIEGRLPLTLHDKTVEIERLHLEEDAGKLLHEAPGGKALPGATLVDFNRCGVPLVEIVSKPVLATAAEAQDYLQSLHQVLTYTAVSDANMEQGSLRCDANVSLRPLGETRLGIKTEVKNLNSFRNLGRAIEYEIERQTEVLEGGGRVVQETRSYDAEDGVTRSMRSKEEAHDYRYFPEPDLPPVVVSAERLEQIRGTLPDLPWDRRRRLIEVYRLSRDDARVLAHDRDLADYYERAAAAHPDNPQGIANWVRTEVLRELKARRGDLSEAVPPARLAALVAMVDGKEISGSAAKEVFAEIWQTGEEPATAVERLGLSQVSDDDQLSAWIDEALTANPSQAEQVRGGKTQVLGFLVGQVMKLSQGRADPQRVRAMLAETLQTTAAVK